MEDRARVGAFLPGGAFDGVLSEFAAQFVEHRPQREWLRENAGRLGGDRLVASGQHHDHDRRRVRRHVGQHHLEAVGFDTLQTREHRLRPPLRD